MTPQRDRAAERLQDVNGQRWVLVRAIVGAIVVLGILAGCDGVIPSAAPTTTAEAAPTPKPVPTSRVSIPPIDPQTNASPVATPAADAGNPQPACPAPDSAPAVPVISASVNGGNPVAGRIGSFTILTCSTSGTGDVVGGDPKTPLDASQGDEIVVSVEAPWIVARWEGYDRPVVGEGVDTWPPVTLPERPRSFTLGVPPRIGGSILTLELVLVTDDGRAVASIPVSFLVRVEP